MRKIIVLSALLVILGLGLYGFQFIIEAWSWSSAQGSNGVSINDVTVTEGDSGTINASFTVSIAQPIDFTARFDFATANGTATVADNDYVARTGSVTFGFGLPTSQTVDIVINGDTSIEGNETFLVNLTRPPETDLGVLDGQGVCTIVNDDSACAFSISPTSQNFSSSAGMNTVAVTTTAGCAWTAASNAAFITITQGASGTGPGTVNYSVAANTGAARTGTMTIAGATFTVTQAGAGGGLPGLTVDDVEVTEGDTGAPSVRFVVRLSHPTNVDVRFSFFLVNGGSALSGIDYDTLFFVQPILAGQIETVVFVGIIGDTRPEADETFFVEIANPLGAFIEDAQAVCTIIDDDLAVLSINDVSVVEGDAGTRNAVFTLSLDELSGAEVSVLVGIRDDRAIGGSDYIHPGAARLIRIRANTLSATVSVPVRGDTEVEPNETFFAELINPTKATIRDRLGVCTIINDECESSISPTMQVVGPGGGNRAVMVSSGCGWIAVSNASWITITPSDGVGDKTISYTVEANPGPARTGTMTIAKQTFTVEQAAAGTPALLIDDVEIDEHVTGTVNAVFKVRLSPPVAVPVTVSYSTLDFTAAAPDDYTATNGTLTFPAGSNAVMTIAVVVKDDTIYEAAELFFVNLANPVNAYIERGQGIGAIIDDEPSTLTFCASDVPKSLSGSGTISSTITIDRDVFVEDLDVGLVLTHDDLNGLGVGLRIPRSPIGAELFRPSLDGFFLRGQSLGNNCSPFPNLVFTRDSRDNIIFGDPPYEGSFRPFFLPSIKANARGTWVLNVKPTDRGLGNTGRLICWCLRLHLGREGLSLTPANASIPIFSPHRVRALLTSNGAAAIGQVVSFEVRGDQGEVRLRAQEMTDEDGEAELRYYDFKPGDNTIEARAIINGVLSIATARVTWVSDGLSGFGRCPFEEVVTGTPEVETKLSAGRNFRDGVLAKTPRGQKYTQLYYQFSTEAVRIMMFNPMLMLRSREILSRYKPVIESMVNGQGASLTEGDLEEIDGFLRSFAAKGSDDFQEAIKGICSDLRDPQMHSEFNITVTDGPRRDLPVGNQLLGIKRIGGIMMLFGFSGLLFLGLTGRRRKTLLKNTKRWMVALLLLAGLANWSYAISGPQKRNDRALRPASSPTARPAPLSFEANQGQSDSQAKFISRGSGYNLFLTPGEAVLSLSTQGHGDAEILRRGDTETRRHGERSGFISPRRPLTASPRLSAASSPSVLRMRLIGASAAPQMSGLNRLPGARNYFIGNDPATWRANVPCFEKVKYESVYPGVDMVYYGQGQKLEYDFIVAPGADPAPIIMAFDGAGSIRMDSSGDLMLQVGEAEVRQLKPVAYQEVNGVRRAVPARYVLSGVGLEEPGDQSLTLKTENSKLKTFQVGFEIGEYDKSRPLIIDPVLTYSTYLGGSGDDEGNSITVDSAGNAYIAGFTDSINFPVSNSSQPVFGGGQQDAFVTKLDPSGALVYSTYLGGNFQDNASGIAVDAAGNAYVTGFTGSTNFPVANAMQPTKNGLFNAFVTKLSPGGSIIYSTHLGGSGGDFGSSIAVDSAGNVYLAGVATSPNFPMSQAIQSTSGGAADVYVAKLNPSATQLLFSTYLGGSDNDGATSIALDSAGNVYVAGVTSSPNFPRASALKASHGGGVFDGFVAKLSSSGAQLIYSTYLGGSGEDRAFRIAVDSAGNAYVTGDTDSADFPVAAALQQTNAGSVDAFVTKIDPSGASLIYSTYLGGSGIDGGTAITVDAAGNSYVTGFTGSTNFPSVDPLQRAFGGGSFDAFAAKLSPSGATLDYCTYLGGSGIDAGFAVAVDVAANLYVMGQTDSVNFPTANPIQPAYGGGLSDVFVSKITAATVSGPRITGVSVSGKRLILTGSGFDNGAKILVDGQSQKTVNDDQNPSTTLIGKKAGKKISPGETVTIQVRNPDGRLSPEFHFTRPVG